MFLLSCQVKEKGGKSYELCVEYSVSACIDDDYRLEYVLEEMKGDKALLLLVDKDLE